MNYFLLFQDAGGHIYSHCNMAAVSNDLAIVKARRIYSSGIGSGYEIWRAGHHIHTEAAASDHPLGFKRADDSATTRQSTARG